jgi:heme A synthase
LIEHRLAVATTFACFLLLLAGGLVHATGSGMACGPDWPLCRGEVFPRMEGGVLFEHGHRLLAMAVGVLTLALAAVVIGRRKERPLRALAVGATVLVVVQALLGRLIVRWNLPMAIKTVHLAVSMAFFCVLILLCFRLRPPAPRAASRPLARLCGLAALAVYLQVVLGAFVRHTSSGLACPGVPLCGGSLWPSFGPGELQMIHRYFALLVAALVVFAGLGARTVFPAAAWAAIALVGVQIGLGALSVLTFLGTATVTAHLGTGALLLADTVFLYLAVRFPVRLPVKVPV